MSQWIELTPQQTEALQLQQAVAEKPSEILTVGDLVIAIHESTPIFIGHVGSVHLNRYSGPNLRVSYFLINPGEQIDGPYAMGEVAVPGGRSWRGYLKLLSPRDPATHLPKWRRPHDPTLVDRNSKGARDKGRSPEEIEARKATRLELFHQAAELFEKGEPVWL